jgi:hypothetical protein
MRLRATARSSGGRTIGGQGFPVRDDRCTKATLEQDVLATLTEPDVVDHRPQRRVDLNACLETLFPLGDRRCHRAEPFHKCDVFLAARSPCFFPFPLAQLDQFGV